MVAKEDPSVTLRWIGDYLIEGERRKQVAILVVDFARSTPRKALSASPLLGLQHILFHNLLALRSVEKGALCKLTGDGAILCFPVDRFESSREACVAAAGEAVCFLKEILYQTAAFREALDGSPWGIRTKCALHFGEVYLVDYSSLYAISQSAPEIGRLFPELPDGQFSCATEDPHGEIVDLAFRVLGHCQDSQVLASEAFVTTLESFHTTWPFRVAGSAVGVWAKGAPGDTMRVREITAQGEDGKGISPVEHVDWQKAKPLCEVLKLADDTLNRMLVVCQRACAHCETLRNNLSSAHSVTAFDHQQERASLYGFVVEFTTRGRASGPDLPESLRDKPVGTLLGNLDVILQEFDVNVGPSLREGEGLSDAQDLRGKTQAVTTALHEFLGTDGLEERVVEQSIAKDTLRDGLALKRLAVAAADYLTAISAMHHVIRHVIDATMRNALGLRVPRLEQ